MACASSAQAVDRVYWANAGGAPSGDISFANLNGSGGADLGTNGTHSPCCPNGVAIDSARGRIYWGTDDTKGVFFASLAGGAVGQLNIAPVAPNPAAYGVAIDPAADRIYWGDNASGKISFARLDGTGGGNLNIAPLTAQRPAGVVIDSAARRIYWADENANEIRFATLAGGGGGTLARAGATVSRPFGLAIDAAAGRIYWANRDVNKISFARLDGNGGDDLTVTGPVTLDFPSGVAIDHAAGRLYWANYNGDTISSANLDGSGARNLNTTGTTIGAPNDPVLLQSPRGVGAPAISGGSLTGSRLACSTGSWAADLAAAFLFRAPRTFSRSWSRDGATIAGAPATSFPTSAPGAYRCPVTASNAAGSASQTTAAHAVSPPAFGSKTLVSLTLAAK